MELVRVQCTVLVCTFYSCHDLFRESNSAKAQFISFNLQRILVLCEPLVKDFYLKRLFPLMDAVTSTERELQQMLQQPSASSGASSSSSSPEPQGEQKKRRVSRSGRITAARRKLLGGGGTEDDVESSRPSDIAAFWHELGLRPDEWRQLACKILDEMFGAGFFQPV